MWHCSVAKRVCAWRSSLTRHSGRLIPTARIVDSNVNRRGSTRCDSPSALDGGDGDDRSNHTFGLVDGRSAGGGGTHAGREGGSSDAGDRAVAGRLVAGSCGGGLCDERQTLRDWVHRYNEAGLDGLYDRRRRNGPPPRLSAEQQAKVAAWVEQDADLERDGVVRWRCVDLQRRITQGVCRHAARAHGGQAVAQAVVPAAVGAAAAPAKQARGTSGFQSDFADLMTAALPPEAAGKPVEIWFTDEARVGQQGTITRVWAKRGSR